MIELLQSYLQEAKNILSDYKDYQSKSRKAKNSIERNNAERLKSALERRIKNFKHENLFPGLRAFVLNKHPNKVTNHANEFYNDLGNFSYFETDFNELINLIEDCIKLEQSDLN